jgi:hypothetical protein
VLHRNFTTYVIGEGSAPRRETLRSSGGRVEVIRFAPDSYCDARWSIRCWHVMDGLKVNGTGSGYFEYRIPWPAELEYGDIRSAVLRIEMSAKRLFGKDREDGGRLDGDFMRGKGTQDPSLNPNAYPMTDEETYPSAVRILVNGVSAGNYELLDDPADHRGILSWRSQNGQLISAHLPLAALKDAARSGEIVLRFVVDESLPGGLAVYGESFGRYPLDPTLLIEKRTGQ